MRSDLRSFSCSLHGHEPCGNDGMWDVKMRQGPEGRPPNISPARKGWDIVG